MTICDCCKYNDNHEAIVWCMYAYYQQRNKNTIDESYIYKTYLSDNFGEIEGKKSSFNSTS